MAVDASIGNSLADILQKLAYFKAGGGRPSVGQQVGEALTAAGSVPGKYAEGLSLADQRAKQIMETAKLGREITPTVPVTVPTSPQEQAQNRMSQLQARIKDIPPERLSQVSDDDLKAWGIEPPKPLPDTKTVMMTPPEAYHYGEATKAQAQAKSYGDMVPVNPATGEIHLSYKDGDILVTRAEAGKYARTHIRTEAGNQPVPTMTQEQALEAGSVPKNARIIANPNESGLTPSAIDLLAQRALAGIVDPMGLGKTVRVPVFNRMAQIKEQTGDSVGAQAIRRSSLMASQAELSNLQKQRGTVMAFANTADRNLDLANQLSDKVDRTGSPVVNRWLLAGKKQIAGDPDVAAFDASVRTAINEYARVTTSATGGAVTTDQARGEVENMLNSAQNPDQVKKVISTLKLEMNNRRAGYDQQISDIQNSISNVGNQLNQNKPISGTAADQYKIGELRTNAQGQTGRYMGNGKWLVVK